MAMPFSLIFVLTAIKMGIIATMFLFCDKENLFLCGFFCGISIADAHFVAVADEYKKSRPFENQQNSQMNRRRLQ